MAQDALQSSSILKLLPSVRSQLHSSPNKPSGHPSVPLHLSFFLPLSLISTAGTPPWIPRPSLEKPSLTCIFFIILFACFLSASQDLSSSPSWERADSGLSEQSVSLLSDGFKPKRANCRKRVSLETEMEMEKRNTSAMSQLLMNLFKSQPKVKVL